MIVQFKMDFGWNFNISLVLEVGYSVREGDKPSKWSNGGVGYAGSADEIEYEYASVLSAVNKEAGWKFDRFQRPDWFDVLDRIVKRQLDKGLTMHWDEQCLNHYYN